MIIAHPMLEFLAVGNKKHFNDDEKINKFINEQKNHNYVKNT